MKHPALPARLTSPAGETLMLPSFGYGVARVYVYVSPDFKRWITKTWNPILRWLYGRRQALNLCWLCLTRVNVAHYKSVGINDRFVPRKRLCEGVWTLLCLFWSDKRRQVWHVEYFVCSHFQALKSDTAGLHVHNEVQNASFFFVVETRRVHFAWRICSFWTFTISSGHCLKTDTTVFKTFFIFASNCENVAPTIFFQVCLLDSTKQSACLQWALSLLGKVLPHPHFSMRLVLFSVSNNRLEGMWQLYR